MPKCILSFDRPNFHSHAPKPSSAVHVGHHRPDREFVWKARVRDCPQRGQRRRQQDPFFRQDQFLSMLHFLVGTCLLACSCFFATKIYFNLVHFANLTIPLTKHTFSVGLSFLRFLSFLPPFATSRTCFIGAVLQIISGKHSPVLGCKKISSDPNVSQAQTP